jgi:hypothetical protein
MLDGLELPEIEEIIDTALHRESQGLPLSVIEELVLEAHRTGMLDFTGRADEPIENYN